MVVDLEPRIMAETIASVGTFSLTELTRARQEGAAAALLAIRAQLVLWGVNLERQSNISSNGTRNAAQGHTVIIRAKKPAAGRVG